MINWLLNLNRKQKIILLAIAIVLIIAPHSASAFFGLENLAADIIAKVVAFIVMLAMIPQFLASVILSWVVSPNFISFSYTRPCNPPDYTIIDNCNPVVGMGLSITKQFVSMLLVVVLVYIAISIALRIGEQNAKRLFWKLIVVALLINFLPVLVGLIVDASNIVMNFFLQSLSFKVEDIATTFDGIKNDLQNAILGSNIVSAPIGLLISVVMMIGTSLITALALGLLAGIFFMRYLAIWIIVIVSPIALVCWILPGMNKIWSQWWHQLIQWSIIGIPIAFFFYIGNSLITLLTGAFSPPQLTGGIFSGDFSKIFGPLITYSTVAIFLLAGMTVGLQSTALLSTQTIQKTRAFGKWAGSTGGRAGAGALRKVGQSEQYERFKQRLNESRVGQTIQSARERSNAFFSNNRAGRVIAGTGRALGWATGITPAVSLAKRGVQELNLQAQEADVRNAKKEGEKYKDATVQRKLTALKDIKGLGAGKIEILKSAMEKGELSDLKEAGLTNDEIIRIVKNAINVNPSAYKEMLKYVPQLSEQAIQGLSSAVKKQLGADLSDEEITQGMTIPQKLIMKIKPEFIAKIDEDAFENADVMDALHKFAGGSHLSNMKPPVLRRFMEEAKRKGKDWYRDNNESLYNWFNSTAAGALGVGLEEANEGEPGPTIYGPDGRPYNG